MPISVIFFGTPQFAVPTLEALCHDSRFWVKLVVTQPERPAGRGRAVNACPVAHKAREHHIPILAPSSLRRQTREFITQAKQLGPFDIGVVIAFGQILPEEILTLPESGCVNLHASLLPRWRGAAPIQRAIIAGDTQTGVCMMKMEKGLDSGPVYSCSAIDVLPAETFGDLHDRLSDLAAKLCLRDLQAVTSGALQPKPQETEGVTYAAKITADETLIDWSGDAAKIEKQIRGLSPQPAAFCWLDGRRLKVLRASAKDPLPTDQGYLPGQICHVDSDGIEVACGTGILALTELQLEGRKRLPAPEFLRGVKLNVGQALS